MAVEELYRAAVPPALVALVPEAAECLEALPPAVAAAFPTLQVLRAGYPHRLFQTLAVELHDHLAAALFDTAAAASLGPEARARLLAVRGREAGAWVLARPRYEGHPCRMSTAEWGFAARLRLGLPHPELQQLHSCQCGRALSSFEAMHILRCQRTPCLTRVHDAVARALGRILIDSGLGGDVDISRRGCEHYFARDPQGRTAEEAQEAGSPWCVPDVVFCSRAGHALKAVDVTLQRSANSRLRESGPAAGQAEWPKMRHYASWLERRGSGRVIPFALEPFGLLGPLGLTLLRRCAVAHASRLARVGGDEDTLEEPVAALFVQQLSVALMQAQAGCFRSVCASAGGQVVGLTEDQVEMERFWMSARLDTGPSLEDCGGLRDDWF